MDILHTPAPSLVVCGRFALYTALVSEDTEHDQLDALVGAALKGLVEAGASAQAIGAFANSYRSEASRILGLTEKTSAESDLQELVTEAVSRVLDEAGVLRKRKRNRAPRAKRFYVLVGGRRTSVTITAAEADRLISEKGGQAQAREFIQHLADIAPPDLENRSLWIRERLHVSAALDKDTASVVRH